MSPEPQSIANDLFDELSLAIASVPPNEFALQRIDRAAEKLSDLGIRASLRGAVAAVRGDRSSVKAQFDRAIALSGQDPGVMHNYALSLAVLGDYHASAAMAMNAADRCEGHIPVLRSIYELLGELAAVDSAASLGAKAEKYGVGLGDTDTMISMARLVKEGGFTEADLLSVTQIARRCARDAGALSIVSKMFITHSFGRATLVYEMLVDAGADVAMGIEQAIFEALVSNPIEIESSSLLTVIVGVEHAKALKVA